MQQSHSLVWVVYKETEDVLSSAGTCPGKQEVQRTAVWLTADQDRCCKKAKAIMFFFPAWSGFRTMHCQLDSQTYSVFSCGVGWILNFLRFILLPLRWHCWFFFFFFFSAWSCLHCSVYILPKLSDWQRFCTQKTLSRPKISSMSKLKKRETEKKEALWRNAFPLLLPPLRKRCQSQEF